LRQMRNLCVHTTTERGVSNFPSFSLLMAGIFGMLWKHYHVFCCCCLFVFFGTNGNTNSAVVSHLITTSLPNFNHFCLWDPLKCEKGPYESLKCFIKCVCVCVCGRFLQCLDWTYPWQPSSPYSGADEKSLLCKCSVLRVMWIALVFQMHKCNNAQYVIF